MASYPLFLAALMVLAAGITALQVAANPYVAVLGPPETASSRLNLAQAFNSLGTTMLGPYLGGLLILTANSKSMETETRNMSAQALQTYRIQEASSVKLPYLIIGLTLVSFAAFDRHIQAPAIPGSRAPQERHCSENKFVEIPSTGVWRHWDFCVRGRGSIDRQLPDQLFQPSRASET